MFCFKKKRFCLTVGNMTREKSDTVEDGADERMLDGDEKQQLARKDEVKFIASDRSNGDAKIDIGNIEKVSKLKIKTNVRDANLK